MFPAKDLPIPRLELRWERVDESWIECTYNLVYPLLPGDSRITSTSNHMTVEIEYDIIKQDEDHPPIKNDHIDAHVRFIAHAKCDAEFLKLPVYLVCDELAEKVNFW